MQAVTIILVLLYLYNHYNLPGTFDSLVNLELLNLRKNQLSHISANLFDKLVNLNLLQLTSNKIAQVIQHVSNLIYIFYLNVVDRRKRFQKANEPKRATFGAKFYW